MADETQSLNLPAAGAGTPNGNYKVANVPKISYQDPASVQTTYAWNTPVDFILSRNLGKVLDMVLQIDVTVSNSGDLSNNVHFPPVPFWFERLETSLGGSAPIETVNKDELFLETLMYLPLQDFQTISDTVNINYDGSFRSSEPNQAIRTGRYFLPLWSNCLNTAQLYVKGFNADWKLRFYLSNGQPNMKVSGTGSTVSVSGLRLLVTEAQLPNNVESTLAAKHSSGIIYNTVNRVRHLDTNMPTSTSSIKEYQLTTFANESAGIVSYFRDAETNFKNLGKRVPLSTIQFRDANSNPYYATDIDGAYNLYYIAPWSISSMPLGGENKLCKENYLIPFSAHVGAVLESGKDLGAYQLSGREKVCLQPAALPGAVFGEGSAPIFVAISYDYMRIKVKHGNAKVFYNRG
jgi:hypothetical protein